jgi:hypothetical protein
MGQQLGAREIHPLNVDPRYSARRGSSLRWGIVDAVCVAHRPSLSWGLRAAASIPSAAVAPEMT